MRPFHPARVRHREPATPTGYGGERRGGLRKRISRTVTDRFPGVTTGHVDRDSRKPGRLPGQFFFRTLRAGQAWLAALWRQEIEGQFTALQLDPAALLRSRPALRLKLPVKFSNFRKDWPAQSAETLGPDHLRSRFAIHSLPRNWLWRSDLGLRTQTGAPGKTMGAF